jgi:hypothetical protein
MGWDESFASRFKAVLRICPTKFVDISYSGQARPSAKSPAYQHAFSGEKSRPEVETFTHDVSPSLRYKLSHPI